MKTWIIPAVVAAVVGGGVALCLRPAAPPAMRYEVTHLYGGRALLMDRLTGEAWLVAGWRRVKLVESVPKQD